MNDQTNNWAKHYIATDFKPVYPTEWVIRTIAGANYPDFKYNKSLYQGKRILDISCGDGRNLELLLDLGFDVYATETNNATIEMLKFRYPNVKFSLGLNHQLPFEDNFFDYALACGSFYYLEKNTSFKDNLLELNRILKPGALFYANLSKPETYVLDKAIEQENGEYLILNDPHNFRNGYRWQVVKSEEDLHAVLSPFLKVYALGENIDNYFGYTISYYIVVCENIK